MYWLLKLGLCLEVKQDESHGELGSSDRASGRWLDTQPLSEPLEPLPDRQREDDPELSVARHKQTHAVLQLGFICTTRLTIHNCYKAAWRESRCRFRSLNEEARGDGSSMKLWEEPDSKQNPSPSLTFIQNSWSSAYFLSKMMKRLRRHAISYYWVYLQCMCSASLDIEDCAAPQEHSAVFPYASACLCRFSPLAAD